MIKCKECGGTIRHGLTFSNVQLDDKGMELYYHHDVIYTDSSYTCEKCEKEYDYEELFYEEV